MSRVYILCKNISNQMYVGNLTLIIFNEKHHKKRMIHLLGNQFFWVATHLRAAENHYLRIWSLRQGLESMR